MLTIIALYFAYSFHHRRLGRIADEALAKLKEIGGKVFPAPKEEGKDGAPTSSVQMISMLERSRREREALSLQQHHHRLHAASPPQMMTSQAGRRLNPKMQPQTRSTDARLTVRSPSPTAMICDDKPEDDKRQSYSKSLLALFGRPRTGNSTVSSPPPNLSSFVPAQRSQFESEVEVSKHRRRRSSAVAHYDTDDGDEDEDEDDNIRGHRRRSRGGHHVKSSAPRRRAKKDYHSDDSSEEDEVEKEKNNPPKIAPATSVASLPVALPVQLRSAAARRIDPISPTQTSSTLPSASATLASSAAR